MDILVFGAPKVVTYQETFTRFFFKGNLNCCKQIILQLWLQFDTHGMTEEESLEWESADVQVAEIEEGPDSNIENFRQINLFESWHNNTFSSEIHGEDL